MEQPIGQIGQERVKQQEEGVCYNHWRQLAKMGSHEIYRRKQTNDKCNAKNDRKNVKIYTIFFAQGAKVSIHESAHNIIKLDFYFFAKYKEFNNFVINSYLINQ